MGWVYLPNISQTWSFSPLLMSLDSHHCWLWVMISSWSPLGICWFLNSVYAKPHSPEPSLSFPGKGSNILGGLCILFCTRILIFPLQSNPSRQVSVVFFLQIKKLKFWTRMLIQSGNFHLLPWPPFKPIISPTEVFSFNSKSRPVSHLL